MADGFPSPFTEESGRQFLERASAQPLRMFAITVDDAVVGSIGIFPETDIHRKNAAIAYWLAEPFWGKGITTKAISQIVEYGFSNFDITRIYAKPYGSNRGSRRALEKSGFELEATIKNGVFKNGQYLDELIYSLRR